MEEKLIIEEMEQGKFKHIGVGVVTEKNVTGVDQKDCLVVCHLPGN